MRRMNWGRVAGVVATPLFIALVIYAYNAGIFIY